MTPRCQVDVLQVVPTLAVGGLERVATDLCVQLRDRFQIGVACLRGEGPLAEVLRDAGVPVYSWGPQHGRRGGYSAPLRLRRLLRDSPVRVVHSHNPPSLFSSVPATRGRPGIQLIHTDHARKFPGRRHYMLGERLCAPATYRFVAVSERGKRDVMQYEHIPAAHIQVIPNGVETARFASVPPPAFDPERGIVLGAVARLTQEKALGALLDAAATLVAEGLSIRVHLAGDGPLRPHLEQQARTLGLADRVHFLGYRADVPAVLAAVDVVVSSSTREGMPLGLLEAMAAGRPVVATAVGGVPEVVVDGETGLLVPPGDGPALAAAVRRVVVDPAWGRALGAAGRARATAHFSLARTVAQYAALYDEALASLGACARATASAAALGRLL